MTAAPAIARRTFADARGRTTAFAVLFAFVALVQPLAYRHSFPTLEDRLGFATSFGANKAVRLFFGAPRDLLTVGGFTAWRVVGILSVVAALWAVLTTVRALRGEEDAGRRELVLAALVTRRTAFLASLAAVLAGAVLLWAAVLAGLTAGRLPVAASAYAALATIAPVPFFAGVGALVSQLAPTRRLATELANAVVVLALVVRVVADTAAGAAWLRWATPLGWPEEMRPFTGPRPEVVVPALLAGAVLLAAAGALAVGRDVGVGLLAPEATAAPRLRLLRSPVAHALRDTAGSIAAWVVGIGFFAAVVGLLSHSFTPAGIPDSLARELRRIGGASVLSPKGALSFYFLFFALAISLFLCAQLAAIRREEAEDRLETILALPVGRRGWLAGRVALAAAGAVLLAVVAGTCAWAAAAAQGGGASLAEMLGAGLNCLPVGFLFLGVGALAVAVRPRAGTAIAYGLVAGTFVWELFGAVLGAPDATLALSPFHEIGLVPVRPFKATAAVLMLAGASAAVLAALALFRRRDVTGA